MTYADLVLRYNRDFPLYGAPGTEGIKDILVDSITRFISRMDLPIITASIVATEGTDTYSMPSTIKKVRDIRDPDGVSVKYAEDGTTRQITFQDSVSTGTYTVYGTPDNLRTNIDTIVPLIPEDTEYVLWTFVEVFAAKRAKDTDWPRMLKSAETVAQKERSSRNRRLDINDQMMRLKDTRGRVIADAANADGLNVDISNQFESDL